MPRLTDTMRARAHPVTLRPKLIALIACPADSPPDGARGCFVVWLAAGVSVPAIAGLVVGVLVGMMPYSVRALHGGSDSVARYRHGLKVLQGVLRIVCQRVQSRRLYSLGIRMPRGIWSHIRRKWAEHGRIVVMGGGKHG